MQAQRGGLVLGLIIGLLAGLALALAVALYVTKAPVPFVNKVPPRTADQDAAEAERNRHWDPNAGLVGKGSAPKPIEPPASAAAAASVPAAGPARSASGSSPAPGARDPLAILAGAPVPPAASAAPPAAAAAASSAGKSAKPGADPFVYFVQAGAFQTSADGEQQRAKLAMLGVETKLIEREQSGRTVFRVRAGPFQKPAEAEAIKEKLQGAGVETMLVRVERQGATATPATAGAPASAAP